MSAGGLPDSVCKSSEAAPLTHPPARINQAPGEERKARTHLSRTLEAEGGNDHEVIVSPWETSRSGLWFNTAALKRLSINVDEEPREEETQMRLLSIAEHFMWSHSTLSYYCNNIQECVLQAGYECDSDAGGVSCRWSLLFLPFLHQVKKRTNSHEHTWNSFFWSIGVNPLHLTNFCPIYHALFQSF